MDPRTVHAEAGSRPREVHVAGAGASEVAEKDAKESEADPFWMYDEGVDELSRETKES